MWGLFPVVALVACTSVPDPVALEPVMLEPGVAWTVPARDPWPDGEWPRATPEEAGVDAPYLCRGGVCGQCEMSVVSCDGQLVHNDHYLTEEEHASGKKIMTCVSRLKGRELVLDL